MKQYLTAFLSVVMISCGNTQKEKNKISAEERITMNPTEVPSIQSKIITKPSGDYGYEIWINGQKNILQPTIPGVEGNHGFKTKEQAERVASLVKSKMTKNIMPPSVSLHELDSLGITH